MRRHGLVLLLAISLTACGFQLRGASPLPAVMERTYIQADAHSPLYFELEQAIQATGAQVVQSASEASATLQIHRADFSRRDRGVDQLGRVNEYEHRLNLAYSLRDSQGRAVADHQQLQLIREQRFNPSDVLASGEEQRILYQEMRRQAVSQLLRRLQSLTQP
ncbi:MAG: LPS assembly lipoprotein LptE [Thiohalomonadaceae bacterium]